MKGLHGEGRPHRMMAMRVSLAAGLMAAFLSGCLMREGNPYNIGKYPHQWDLPGPETEEKVFGPMPFEDVEDFVAERESDGWEVIGFEKASLPEEIMVNTVELDQPSKPKRVPWTPHLPKTMDERVDPPPRASIPPYLEEGVKPHRQKYLVVMRRWQ